MTVLRLEQLRHAYAEQPVLQGFDLHQKAGEHRLLLGPSGSGKTTLISLISGLLTPDQGIIEVCGERMSGAASPARDDLRRRRIGVIFQTLRLVGALSVTDNLLLAQRLAGQPRDRGTIEGLLSQLGIGHRAYAMPRALSQGEAQRAAIARALVGRPALLIADEPTSALDDANAASVARLLLNMAEANGSTLLVATHDTRLRQFIPETVALQPLREAA
jgi:putative ABC transport system ATP-binding protein